MNLYSHTSTYYPNDFGLEDTVMYTASRALLASTDLFRLQRRMLTADAEPRASAPSSMDFILLSFSACAAGMPT